jgi:hypothetical protein
MTTSSALAEQRESRLRKRREQRRMRGERIKAAKAAEGAEHRASVCKHCHRRLEESATRVHVANGVLHPGCVGRAWCARCKREVLKDDGRGTPIGRIHVDCELMPASRAAEVLDVGLAQFRRLVEQLGIEPDEVATNPHHKSGPPMRLYLMPKIQAMATNPKVLAARDRKGGPPPKHYDAVFAKRYGDPTNALAAACEAMFNLNRYTRHSTCSDAHRTEILDLKAKLIEHLYSQERYTDRVEKLTKELPAKECFGCDGTGTKDSGSCERCDGTGVFAGARTVASYAFIFTVDGQRYSWMQPDRVMTFEPRVEQTRRQEAPGVEPDTALNIPRSKLAEAKALVRFALGHSGSRGTSPARRAPARPRNPMTRRRPKRIDGVLGMVRITKEEPVRFFLADLPTNEAYAGADGNVLVFADRAQALDLNEKLGHKYHVIGMAEEKWALFQRDIPAHVVVRIS